ncbi:GNAT family N-acetyltransferase [Kitasatospora sp. SUK 42]|uniref:GNAT family N-acetyltransferase n=1 Tax=Kitasatospora sp. SUK 42 TaxID=1588882 RepID=UPI0018C9798E|nr:GNAT family N-acetyltransferase [Kitasatospora sp. SUK 42]MBV2156514.1 GNAT family N-acetyltransferase [Kitasatospora sp. SUK 42]
MRSWDAAVERAQDRLGAGTRLRACLAGEERRFALWDLASLVEGELGELVDPDGLAPPVERGWRERLGESGREWPGGELYRRRYWILDERGAVAGTVAVDNWTKGPSQLAVSSLYVRPGARGRGLAAAALDEVYGAATAEGLPGFQLEAHWSWQSAVRYYLRRGLWVVGWKRSISLARMPQLPLHRVREEDGRLLLLVADRARGWVPILAAGREGRWLRLDETADYRGCDGWVHEYARSTLALYLALAGRPLVRGPQWWAEAWRWSDAGEPEGLAYKIEEFEQAARTAGRTPVSPYRPVRLPGQEREPEPKCEPGCEPERKPGPGPAASPQLADSGDG